MIFRLIYYITIIIFRSYSWDQLRWDGGSDGQVVGQGAGCVRVESANCLCKINVLITRDGNRHKARWHILTIWHVEYWKGLTMYLRVWITPSCVVEENIPLVSLFITLEITRKSHYSNYTSRTSYWYYNVFRRYYYTGIGRQTFIRSKNNCF